MKKTLPKHCDSELVYLAELTRRRIKPLSRWEKPLNTNVLQWLRSLGLCVETVPRKTRLRKNIPETVFSSSSRYVDLYAKRFGNTLLARDTTSRTLEGFLFGYPSCCVREFVKHGYSRNGLAPAKQRILFHWACPQCRSTPELLPYYRDVFDSVPEYSGSIDSWHHSAKARRLAAAVTAGLFLTAGSLMAQVEPNSKHFIGCADDVDMDGLSATEEILLGTSTGHDVSQISGLKMGAHWALHFLDLIDSLATTQQTDRPYVVEHQMRGLESCSKCGSTVNMGYITIVNPVRDLQIELPYIALHFMSCGCLSYDGDLHSGRIDVDLLKRILYPCDAGHGIPVSSDRDKDGLTDREEEVLYLNPDLWDIDGDNVRDGAQLAESLIRLYTKLPVQPDGMHGSITNHLMFGTENCAICGETSNMGYVEIANPETGRKCQVHYLGLHAMAHGSFGYSGSVSGEQRPDAVELYRAMKTHQLWLQDDEDADGLKTSEEAHFGTKFNKADSDDDGISDGKELAVSMANTIDRLPQSAVSGPYVKHHYMLGSWNCLICGAAVNMGYLEVYNQSVNSEPVTIPYYALHFMKKGSFAYEGRVTGAEWKEGRIDPVLLAKYLDIQTGIRNSENTLPTGVELTTMYPNPLTVFGTGSSTGTRISFRLSFSASVELAVYNMLGQKIRSLASAKYSPGEHTVNWSGTDDMGRPVPEGMYLLRLSSGSGELTGKLVVSR